MKRYFAALTASVVILSGCSSKNRYEREADRITQAVIANNMVPVAGDFDSAARVTITRVAVARLSDELNTQGPFRGVHEVQVQNEAPNMHAFDAKFEKHMYAETLVVDDDGKVREWHIHMKAPVAPSTP
jgi:hypothetical protein